MSPEKTVILAIAFVLVWVGVAVVPGFFMVAVTMKECGYPRFAVLPVLLMGFLTLAFGGYVFLERGRPRVVVALAFVLPILVPVLAFALGELCNSGWGQHGRRATSFVEALPAPPRADASTRGALRYRTSFGCSRPVP